MLDHLRANNRTWAELMVSGDPDFFRRLERQHAPEFLWIGCSDSRVPANEIVGLDPGELFVHRNVANLAPPQDANYLSVLQFAVDVLKVKHILVVGHYGCGGVIAAVDGKRRGLVDHWLHPIRELCQDHYHELDAISDHRARLNRLCELNVIRQVRNVASDVFVQDAWARGQNLCVHGWVYSLGNGLVTDLNVTVSRPCATRTFSGTKRSNQKKSEKKASTVRKRKLSSTGAWPRFEPSRSRLPVSEKLRSRARRLKSRRA
jgi:carbonic anhydrase